MAVEQGTASNFLDFYSKLRAFLTSNSALAAAGQAWQQIAGNVGALGLDDAVTLQGPGLSGADEIRVRLRPVYSVVNGRYNLELVGLPVWNPELSQLDQFNASGPKYIHLWNNAMPYVFVANGRRFVAVAQVTSVVQACYGGFLMQYALPSEYPYPLVVGGASDQSAWSYTETSAAHSHFVNPSGSMAVYTPFNNWVNFVNFTAPQGSASWVTSSSYSVTSPYSGSPAGENTAIKSLRECFGGEYPLHRIALFTTIPSTAQLGALDGCFWTPGVANSHGNPIEVAGEDYIAVQNTFRTDNFLGYWALKLE